MLTKTIEYGTTYNVTVISAEKNVIAVEAKENGEGYILMGHGLSVLPKKGDEGKITFTKNNSVHKGHWEYTPK